MVLRRVALPVHRYDEVSPLVERVFGVPLPIERSTRRALLLDRASNEIRFYGYSDLLGILQIDRNGQSESTMLTLLHTLVNTPYLEYRYSPTHTITINTGTPTYGCVTARACDLEKSEPYIVVPLDKLGIPIPEELETARRFIDAMTLMVEQEFSIGCASTWIGRMLMVGDWNA